MAASHAPVLDAIASQLIDALDRYEHDVQTLADTWLDMDCYREVSDRIETIRGYCAALPRLSAPWVALLIAHADLVHCLWRSQALPRAERAAAVRPSRARHDACVAVLRERCRRDLAPPSPS